MEVVTRPSVVDDSTTSAVSWGSIIAGAVAACALTLILIAFGAGIGLASVSPWSGSGVSATTFTISAGIYLLIVAVMSSAVGGYLAARLRSRWVTIHANEAFFRDTAHGLMAWALASLLLATVLSSAASGIIGSAVQGLGMGAPAAATQASQTSGPTDLVVDRLLRPGEAAAPAGAANTRADSRAELSRLLASSARNGGEVSTTDRTYVARVVAAQTGMSQADAERRVNEVITEAKQAADTARKTAMKFSLWLAASLLIGAFAASLAAVEGGQLRDGVWDGTRLTPRSL